MARTIFITEGDLVELRRMIDRTDGNNDGPYLTNLEAELGRAKIVAAEDVPRDAVTMNSKVLLYDLDTRGREMFELVYPWHADADNNRVSVLAPIGTALIGARVGDVIRWPVPAGVLRFRIEELIYQPERDGVLTAS
jgi:regulator of nucleoside diphosphate kinase